MFIAVLSGCQKPEGPAEHAGKEIDKATDKASQAVENIQDTAKGNKK